MQSSRAFFLYSGITSAVFRQSGNIPVSKDALMQCVSGRIMWLMLLKSMLHGMESGPLDFFFASCFTALITSSVVHGCRNMELGGSPQKHGLRGVLVIKTMHKKVSETQN